MYYSAEILDAIDCIQQFGRRIYLVGAWACTLRGVPLARATGDLDVFSPLSTEERDVLGKYLRTKYKGTSEKWRWFGVQYEFPSGAKLDLGTSKSVFNLLYDEEWDKDQTLAQSRVIFVPPTEDIIVMKVVAWRKKDIEDLKSILPRCWENIDRDRVVQKLRKYTRKRSETRFNRLLNRLGLAFE